MKKVITLNSYKNRQIIILLCSYLFTLITIAIYVVLLVAFKTAMKGVLPYILLGLIGLEIVVSLLLTILFINKTYNLYHQGIYNLNKNNIEAIKDDKIDLLTIEDSNIKELNELNNLYKEINQKIRGRTIIDKKVSYDNLTFNYINKDIDLIDETSFRNNLETLINLTQAFRNALVEFNYDLGDELLSTSDIIEVVNNIKKYLSYEGILIALKDDNLGFYVYIPTFDNISQIKEEIEDLLKHISIVKVTKLGKKVVPAQVNLVAYPYSEKDRLFIDLKVASRKDDAINIYLPHQIFEPNNQMLLSHRNINAIARINERLASIEVDVTNIDQGLDIINEAIKDICHYYDFDETGVIFLNESNRSYNIDYAYSAKGKYLLKQEKTVSTKFINTLFTYRDLDNSYYFSDTKHLNSDLVAYFDSNDIASGLFYVFTRNKKPFGALFFINENKNLHFSSELRDSLILFANKIGDYYKMIKERKVAYINEKRFDDLIRLSNEYIYGINKKDYTIAYMSPAFKNIAIKAKEGDICYQAIYGQKEPCKACPLSHRKRMIEILQRKKLETATIINHDLDDNAYLRLLPSDNKVITRDRINEEYLTNSYYSMLDVLNAKFDISSGTLLYLSIDNMPSLIKRLNNDGYIKTIRKFFHLLEKELDQKLDIYAYKNDCFVIILPTNERKDIIALVEQAYLDSKKIILENKKAFLSITYFAFSYPNKEHDLKAFLLHNEKVMTGYHRNDQEDYLYFADDNFKRSASREVYMLENINESFKENKFKIQYQPVIRNKDRLIHSMELLLRVNDAKTNEPLDIQEVINVAFNHNHTEMISNALMNCIDDLYKKHGYTFFSSVGLEHLSINADYTYFKAGGLINKLMEISTENNVPKDFLMLEIDESELAKHYDNFKHWIKKLNALVVCDKYEGKYLSVAQLHDLGVNQIKVSRYIVNKIDHDIEALDKCRNILEEANKHQMSVAYIGVENRIQTDLLHDDIIDFYFQGYYFYKPMDDTQAFKVLRETSMRDVGDLDN